MSVLRSTTSWQKQEEGMDPLTILGLVLGILGIAISIGIAFWQNSRAKKAEAELNGILRSLPSQVLDNMARLLQNNQSETAELYGMMNSEKMLHSKYVDLDGDGQEELIVQYPYGAHGSAMQVFGLQNREFKFIAELLTNTPSGFIAEDVNNDDRIEIVTHETSEDYPFVLGLRDEVWYRLENTEFVEIKRTKLYEPQDVDLAYADINKQSESLSKQGQTV
jgi:hypothetical protein